MMQVTLKQAEVITGLHIKILRKLVRSEILDGIAHSNGDKWYWGTCDLSQAQAIDDRLNDARRDTEGVGILATDAAQKYGFDATSIYAWHRAGWIDVIGIEQGIRYFNEGDIAFARALADLSGHRQGKPLFPGKRQP